MSKDSSILNTLTIVLNKMAQPLQKKKIDWVIIGSLSSKLQGCAVEPKDIDILVKDAKSVAIVANYFTDYFVEESQNKSITEKNEKWRSTVTKPVDESVDEWGFKWVFARWDINNYEIEIAHITPPEGKELWTKGIWEAGPGVWKYIKAIDKFNHSIPVIPLEIQLETNMGRGLTQRVDGILKVFKEKGYDKDLIKQALDPSRYPTFLEKIKD